MYRLSLAHLRRGVRGVDNYSNRGVSNATYGTPTVISGKSRVVDEMRNEKSSYLLVAIPHPTCFRATKNFEHCRDRNLQYSRE